MTRGMTPEEIKAAAAELIQRTRVAQGLPEKVVDPLVIARIVELIRRPPSESTRG